jgi:hypothetical protein
MLFAWALFGAVIGLAAAQRKGFSAAGGIIGGLMLGPLAFLMFLVSGVSAEDSNRKKCPYCAEFVQRDAQVCKHCKREISPRAVVQARHAREAARKGVSSVPSGERHRCNPERAIRRDPGRIME